MGKSYKPKRRKIAHTVESLELLKAKKKERMIETLDRIGYRTEKEYTECCSHLAW